MKNFRLYMMATGIPFLLLTSPLVGYGIGYGIDYIFETEPYLSIVFLILGVVSGFREVRKIIKKLEKNEF